MNRAPIAVLSVLCALLASACNQDSPNLLNPWIDTLPVTALKCQALPPPAPAPVFRSTNPAGAVDMLVESLVAPGNSGHMPSAPSCPTAVPPGSCIAPDQAPATYGPHLDDQRVHPERGHMYWASQFKDGRFFDTTGKTPDDSFALSAPHPVTDTVNIWRDDFGVPVIHANTAYGVWYGAGYALAQERLFILDQAVRLSRGTSAATNGTGSLSDDVQKRIIAYSQTELEAMTASRSLRAKEALAGHIAGINAWVDEVNAAGPPQANALMPQEMVFLNYAPTHITAEDMMALGVEMTRFVAAQGGDEMANVKALRDLEAVHGTAAGRAIFRDLNWVNDDFADATIVSRRFTNISTPPSQRNAVFEAMADYAATLPLELASGDGTGAFQVAEAKSLKVPEGFQWPLPPAQLARALKQWAERPHRAIASYMMVASPDITADQSTLLVNGPQLGYGYPGYLVEVEVHGGGYDARGVTVAGLPVVGIGFGERTAWGLTTGDSKTIDSFIVELNPENSEQYRHQGQWKNMDCRDEVVNYRTTSNGAPNVSEPPPGVNSVNVRACRTVHGPVVARTADGQWARAIQYGMWGREVDTIEAVLSWNQVDTAAEFHEAMKQATWNENTMYADADGNIAYYHPGLHPWRHPTYDQRLPARGDGTQDHCGTLPFDRTPQVINPPRGYVHNWNNKPALGWGDSTGGDAAQDPSGSVGRNYNWGQVIRAELEGDGLTHTDLVEMDKRIGRIDPRGPSILAALLACDGGCALEANQQELIDVLKAWDGQHYNDAIDLDDESATDTPAQTVFGHVLQAMVDDLVSGNALPDDFVTRHARRGRHPYDAGTFHKLLAKIFDPGKTSIPVTHDWLGGRSTEQFIKDALAAARAEMETQYGSADVQQFRRIHHRDPVLSLISGVVGPSLTMPHQDRGTWLKLVGFVPTAE